MRMHARVLLLLTRLLLLFGLAVSIVQAQTAPFPPYADCEPRTGSVNVQTRELTYLPDPDLTVYNPIGPSVAFARGFYTDHAQLDVGSPGLTSGWKHEYDVVIKPNANPDWDDPLILIYPNGSQEVLAPETRYGTPTGVLLPPNGAPYLVRGVPGAQSGRWLSITITHRDQTQWQFTPHASGLYVLTALLDRLGHGANLVWDANRRLTSINNGTTTLLTCTYNGDGTLAAITDAYGRKVTYTFSTISGITKPCLTVVSQIVSSSTPTPPMRYTYGYLPYNGLPRLGSISEPSPTGTGVSTHTFTYTNWWVMAQTDPNGNRREYTYYIDYALVKVVNSQGQEATHQQWWFDGNGRLSILVDGRGYKDWYYYDDYRHPYRPTRIIGKDGRVTAYTYDIYGNVTTVTKND